MDKYSIFSPVGIKPEEYKIKYPELKRVPEFDNLPVKTLIFVWWYSSPTSPIVNKDKKKKAQEALTKSGWSPGKKEQEDIESLRFPENIALAIDKMGAIDEGARYKAYKMVHRILHEFGEIIETGIDGFKNKVVEGKGEERVETEVTDVFRYVQTASKIADTLGSLINAAEEGFGVSIKGEGEEDDIDGSAFDSSYFENR